MKNIKFVIVFEIFAVRDTGNRDKPQRLCVWMCVCVCNVHCTIVENVSTKWCEFKCTDIELSFELQNFSYNNIDADTLKSNSHDKSSGWSEL